MSERFDFIILPPDAFHMTMRDRISDARSYINEVQDVVERLTPGRGKVLVKYRTPTQFQVFPTSLKYQIGYGKLLDLCAPGTVVIGRPGSATWECLLNDITFYCYWNYSCYQDNLFTDAGAVQRLMQTLHVADCTDVLFDNMRQQRIYKQGHSKKSLLHSQGRGLSEIVSTILGRQGQ